MYNDYTEQKKTKTTLTLNFNRHANIHNRLSVSKSKFIGNCWYIKFNFLVLENLLEIPVV